MRRALPSIIPDTAFTVPRIEAAALFHVKQPGLRHGTHPRCIGAASPPRHSRAPQTSGRGERCRTIRCRSTGSVGYCADRACCLDRRSRSTIAAMPDRRPSPPRIDRPMTPMLAAVGAVVAALAGVDRRSVPADRGADPHLVLVFGVIWIIVAGSKAASSGRSSAASRSTSSAPRPLGSTAFALLVAVGGAVAHRRLLRPGPARSSHRSSPLLVLAWSTRCSCSSRPDRPRGADPLAVDPVGAVLPSADLRRVDRRARRAPRRSPSHAATRRAWSGWTGERRLSHRRTTERDRQAARFLAFGPS